jgi:hypothetical protein
MPPWMIGCSMPNISVIAVFTRASKARGAHAAADAHGDDAVFGLAPAAFDQAWPVRRAPVMP